MKAKEHARNKLYNLKYCVQVRAGSTETQKKRSKPMKTHPLTTLTLLLAATSVQATGLNDTGLNQNQYSTDSALQNSEPASHPGQDPRFGRDAAAASGALVKIGGGMVGFDFTKVCNSGEAAGTGACPVNPALGSGANDWACTRDNVTGLLWEVKTDDNGLRDKDRFYTWYNSNASSNGGDPGIPTAGDCVNTACDTEKYAAAVNVTNLCGHTDWRLPRKEELRSLVDYSKSGVSQPTIDTAFYPNTRSLFYWSASVSASITFNAWGISFVAGHDDPFKLSGQNVARLVSSGQ
jgi:hypothetical protein